MTTELRHRYAHTNGIQQERPTEINELPTRFLTQQVATGAMT
jgi:hypothetical protein